MSFQYKKEYEIFYDNDDQVLLANYPDFDYGASNVYIEFASALAVEYFMTMLENYSKYGIKRYGGALGYFENTFTKERMSNIPMGGRFFVHFTNGYECVIYFPDVLNQNDIVNVALLLKAQTYKDANNNTLTVTGVQYYDFV